MQFVLYVVLMDNGRYDKDCERIDSEGNCGDHVFTIKQSKCFLPSAVFVKCHKGKSTGEKANTSKPE